MNSAPQASNARARSATLRESSQQLRDRARSLRQRSRFGLARIHHQRLRSVDLITISLWQREASPSRHYVAITAPTDGWARLTSTPQIPPC
jgi:hypothetical protein